MGLLKEHSEVLHVLFIHLRLRTFFAGWTRVDIDNCDQTQIKLLLKYQYIWISYCFLC